MKKEKVTNYNKDNILGWSEADFRDVICSMVNVRFLSGQPLTPLMARTYLNEAETWHKEKLGLTEEFFKQEEIKRLKEKLKELEVNNNDKTN